MPVPTTQKSPAGANPRGLLHEYRDEEIVKRSILGRPGSDLLFQVSTIGAEDFGSACEVHTFDINLIITLF
jgi:hypothetical protein